MGKGTERNNAGKTDESLPAGLLLTWGRCSATAGVNNFSNAKECLAVASVAELFYTLNHSIPRLFQRSQRYCGCQAGWLRGICSKQTPSSSPFHEHEIWKAKDRDNIICEDLRHILILTPITVGFPKPLFMVTNRSSWVTFVVSFDFVIQFLRHKSATRRKICELCFSYRSSGSHFKSERSQILQSGC